MTAVEMLTAEIAAGYVPTACEAAFLAEQAAYAAQAAKAA